MKVFWLAAGAAVGYVAGTKAGRERYEQIMAAARDWANKPAVADAVDKGERLAERGKDAAMAKVHDVSDAVTAKLPPGSDTGPATTRAKAAKTIPATS